MAIGKGRHSIVMDDNDEYVFISSFESGTVDVASVQKLAITAND